MARNKDLVRVTCATCGGLIATATGDLAGLVVRSLCWRCSRPAYGGAVA